MLHITSGTASDEYPESLQCGGGWDGQEVKFCGMQEACADNLIGAGCVCGSGLHHDMEGGDRLPCGKGEVSCSEPAVGRELSLDGPATAA